MRKEFEEVVKRATGADKVGSTELIQSLWSGYGEILRVSLPNHAPKSVVVKHVQLPENSGHPRGWNTDNSHERKVKSYQVETVWYRDFAKNVPHEARIPHCLGLESVGDEVIFVMEDLNEVGFPGRRHGVTWVQVEACLRWLAWFHAQFVGVKPSGLWEVGTYWHLETRPDELVVLKDKALKAAAHQIDAMLNQAQFQTLVHGDAKLANFCFSTDGAQVAAVDFQYVGGGCGMKDVAYFIGSCLDEDECERLESELLNCYFGHLHEALAKLRPEIDAVALEKEWRELFPVAWTDFHRFLKGWSPGHWKINCYSERLAREVVSNL